MVSFKCDYLEGAHPQILKRLQETNFAQWDGYGEDPACESAKRKIRAAFGCPDAEVFLLVGGTQTNETVISALLRNYEGVVAAQTGHIAVHEAGAVEHSGHKVLTLPSHAGKMDAADLGAFLTAFEAEPARDHMVFPGLVYISLPTEYGTVYSRAELEALRDTAHRHGLGLYIDGARLGYALASPAVDFGPEDLPALCDVFYVGGTKVGALCGEAVVFPRKAPAHFFTTVKQHGALLAKGRLLGVQFDTLFTDDLYFKISKNAIQHAQELVSVLKRKGIPFFLESPTNQQFVILSDAQLVRLLPDIQPEEWEPYDATHKVVRFATSWATTREQLQALESALDKL